MNRRIRLIFIFAAIMLLPAVALAYTVGDENLNYDVYFKWGIISKKAGEVTVNSLVNPDGTFQSTLIGHSAKWADRFYTVRDTLQGRISQNGYYPLSYQLISHEGGKFKRETITYTRDDNQVTGICNRYYQAKNSDEIIHSKLELTADGYTLDMLSAFYYMRFMDYQNMEPGQTKVLYIFSGKAKETLTITYQGTGNFSYKSVSGPVYKVKFSFTSKGGKRSSGNIYAWVSMDAERIPYKLQGTLPIGNIQCLYTPSY